MLAAYRARDPIEFCCPGHRGGRQTDPETAALLGKAFLHDVTQVPDIDDLLNPRGSIADAQALAADLWGARHTHFLVNGTSSGIQAAFVAVCKEGDVVAVPRAVHRSVVEGFILSGAVPRWMPCAVDPALGCAVPPRIEQFEEASRGARMVVATRPTYHGHVCSLDFPRGDAVLLVDEAWGAHLGFHPALPDSACHQGADIVVNSTHKTAGALSGGSMLHVASERVDADRIAQAVRMLTTTSAYYPVLASLDGARRDLALHGRARLGRVLSAARAAREALRGLVCVSDTGDGTRLAFSASGMGWSGTDLADAIRRTHRIEVELADEVCIVAQVSGDVDAAALRELEDAVRTALTVERAGCGGVLAKTEHVLPVPDVVASPREAFQARHVTVPIQQALNRIAAEMVCPYPPGMAVVSYGERITADVLCAIRSIRGRVQGPADPSLSSLRVLE